MAFPIHSNKSTHRAFAESHTALGLENMDVFDGLPDAVVLIIFNFVFDGKTLIRCRAVSKRFNSLVPQVESLLLKIDSMVSPESDHADSSLNNGFSSMLNSLHNVVYPSRQPAQTQPPLISSPVHILRDFQTIRDLEVELPAGDIKVEEGDVVMWRAEYGRTLRTCVIFGFRESGTSPPTRIPLDFSEGLAGGLKLRVKWTVGALVAASSRHYLLRKLLKKQKQLRNLVVMDKKGEGIMVMDKDGLREFREASVGSEPSGDVSVLIGCVSCQGECHCDCGRKKVGRTKIPDVELRMRHVLRLDIEGDAWLGGPTLVIVKPTSSTSSDGEDQQEAAEDDEEQERKEAKLAMEAFGGGVHGPVVRTLLKTRGSSLGLNSF